MRKILSLILALMMLISVLSVMPVTALDDETEILGPGVDNNAPSDEVFLLGDADGDGNVNVKDATLIQKSVAGIVTLGDESAILSDADRSGDVNVKDATVIQKYVAGLLGKYSFVGEPFDVNPETYRCYFYMPSHWLNESTATTGDTAGIYWSEGTDTQDKFPGIKAHKTDIEGIYYYDVPADVEKIVWSNFFDGGDDKKAPYCTDEINTVELDTPDYRMDETKQHPESAVVAESMIFITDLSNYNQDHSTGKILYIGEWFYYYGNGEYGASEVRGDDYILTEPTINRVPPSM